MRVHFDFSALRRTTWREYSVRFLFGGMISVLAGILAQHFGPGFGGLFLAFPAIFPASATLMDKHETTKKLKAGIIGSSRGRQAVALDAYGAAIGSIGLAAFAFSLWKLLPVWNGSLAILTATVAWLAVSVLTWRVSRMRRSRRHSRAAIRTGTQTHR